MYFFAFRLMISTGTGPSKRLNAAQQRLVSSPMKELDTVLALLAAAAPVDVMPGKSYGFLSCTAGRRHEYSFYNWNYMCAAHCLQASFFLLDVDK